MVPATAFHARDHRGHRDDHPGESPNCRANHEDLAAIIARIASI